MPARSSIVYKYYTQYHVVSVPKPPRGVPPSGVSLNDSLSTIVAMINKTGY